MKAFGHKVFRMLVRKARTHAERSGFHVLGITVDSAEVQFVAELQRDYPVLHDTLRAELSPRLWWDLLIAEYRDAFAAARLQSLKRRERAVRRMVASA